jgi:RNA polymerase sigma-70 factor (ECF subfamily)
MAGTQKAFGRRQRRRGVCHGRIRQSRKNTARIAAGRLFYKKERLNGIPKNGAWLTPSLHSPRMNPSPPPQPYPSAMADPTQPAAAPSATTGEPMLVARTSEVDASLVRRMQQGEERALGEFYDRWFPVVNCLVTRIVKSPDDSEDVVEETFWQAWRQASRFEADRGSVQTWLMTIARSRALDRIRSIKRLRQDSLEPAAFDEAANTTADSIVATPTDPSLHVEHQERKAAVLAALAELPREQREALELGYFGGLSQSEIAERTGQPLGTVKTRMRLAMQKLKGRLAVLREDAQ